MPPTCTLCSAGKELALAARQEDELRLKRMIEARRLEKEEEARAREKIRIKLGGGGSTCIHCPPPPSHPTSTPPQPAQGDRVERKPLGLLLRLPPRDFTH